jgi:hypothetical protein
MPFFSRLLTYLWLKTSNGRLCSRENILSTACAGPARRQLLTVLCLGLGDIRAQKSLGSLGGPVWKRFGQRLAACRDHAALRDERSHEPRGGHVEGIIGGLAP